MAVVEKLMVAGEKGGLDFGNYNLSEKTKLSDFPFNGSLYKVKTFRDMTKLEKDDCFLYESEPGTAVSSFCCSEKEISFSVEGPEDAQITVAGEADAAYTLTVDGTLADEIKTGLSGKISFGLVLEEGRAVKISLIRQ